MTESLCRFQHYKMQISKIKKLIFFMYIFEVLYVAYLDLMYIKVGILSILKNFILKNFNKLKICF